MHGYVLVSCKDPLPEMRRPLGAALSHISSVGHCVRINSRTLPHLHQRIIDAELAVRTEWTSLQQKEPRSPLTEIIFTISSRHAIWPGASEFRTTNRGKGDKGEKGNWEKNLG